MEKVSLKKCKETLEKDGSTYTDQEVIEIREFLYMLAELDYKAFLKHQTREKEFKKEKEAKESEKEE